MRRYLFLDLDDTMFQTLRKCADDGRLQACAYLPDGSAHSFATHKQQWLWRWFSQGFSVVPVTGRDGGAFARVSLPFSEEAVLDHGAVILDRDGNQDRCWARTMLGRLGGQMPALLALWRGVEAHCAGAGGYHARLVEDFGATWYGVIKHDDGGEAPLRALLDAVIAPHPAIGDGTLRWHLNGNNLAVLPRCVNKEDAVAYLLAGYRRRHPELLTFGAGDSRSDAAFMSLCDYAIVPRDTQLSHHLASAR